MDQINGYEKGLPLGVEFENGQAFITANYSDNPDIPLGAELLTIDGTPLSTIKQNLITHPGIYFAWKLWLLEGSSPEYQAAILPAGEKTPVNLTIPGMTFKEIEKRMLSDKPREEVTYRTLPEEKIGILTLNGFMSIYEPVKQAFRQIQEDGVQNLIIDIRENGGGRGESLDQFMNYLTDQPYQKCYKCAFIRPWENVENRYQGHVYLLIGPDTMSAAVILANILQDHQLATLVGEETAQTSSFCGYVMIGGEPLPKTGLRYMVSGMCYIRPNGIVDGHGVIPDMIVKTTINDQITGNDPVLDYTLKMIQDGQ
jgi:C-terminal processing protease CtpA/Prc